MARIAPDAADVPVFPSYDLDRQFRVIDDVGRLSPVPVPELYWSEPDAQHVGAPFFVMGRVDGVVPPDLMPYTFGDNWLHDATPEERGAAAVGVGARAGRSARHRAGERTVRLPRVPRTTPGSPLRSHVAHTRAWYDWVAEESGPSPVIERTFGWLERPLAERRERRGRELGRLSDRQRPVPRVPNRWRCSTGRWRVSVLASSTSHGWCTAIGCSRTSPDRWALPGLPDFMRAEDVLAEYERRSGYTPRDLEFFGTYAALQWAIVFVRTARRSVHFGEREMPDQLDEVIVNRDGLEAMLAGTYWN